MEHKSNIQSETRMGEGCACVCVCGCHCWLFRFRLTPSVGIVVSPPNTHCGHCNQPKSDGDVAACTTSKKQHNTTQREHTLENHYRPINHPARVVLTRCIVVLPPCHFSFSAGDVCCEPPTCKGGSESGVCKKTDTCASGRIVVGQCPGSGTHTSELGGRSGLLKKSGDGEEEFTRLFFVFARWWIFSSFEAIIL